MLRFDWYMDACSETITSIILRLQFYILTVFVHFEEGRHTHDTHIHTYTLFTLEIHSVAVELISSRK